MAVVGRKGVVVWSKDGVKSVCMREDWRKCKEHKGGSLTPPNTKAIDANDWESTFNDPFADSSWDTAWEQAGKIAGFDKFALVNEYDFTWDELSDIERRPSKANQSQVIDTDDALWEVYQDRSRRQHLAPEVQSIIAMKKFQSQEDAHRKLSDALDKETMNPDFPGNREIGGDKPKSQLWYELLNKQGKMFQERADLVIEAAYALGLDKSDNPHYKRALQAGSRGSYSRRRAGDDKFDRTYWSDDFSQLMYAVESSNRSGQAQAAYQKKAAEYDDSVNKRNANIRAYGTDFSNGQPKYPHPELIEARVVHRLAEKKHAEATTAFKSANPFNRRKRKDALDAANAELISSKWRLDSEEMKK